MCHCLLQAHLLEAAEAGDEDKVRRLAAKVDVNWPDEVRGRCPSVVSGNHMVA